MRITSGKYRGLPIKSPPGDRLRPTQDLVREALFDILRDKITDCVFLDLCTGTGCIGITLKKQLPDLSVTCSDKSKDALHVARKNSKQNDVEIKLINSDLFDKVYGKFDMIVSNPPYIKTSDYYNLDNKILDFEPKMALVAGYDGLSLIKEIIISAKNKLNTNGHLLIEIGYNQGEHVKKIFEENGYKDINIYSDYSDFDRIATARKV